MQGDSNYDCRSGCAIARVAASSPRHHGRAPRNLGSARTYQHLRLRRINVATSTSDGDQGFTSTFAHVGKVIIHHGAVAGS